MSLILDEVKTLQKDYSTRLHKIPDFIAISYPLFEKLKRELRQSGFRGFLNPSKPTIFGMQVLNYKAPYDDDIKLFGLFELETALKEYENNQNKKVFTVQRITKTSPLGELAFAINCKPLPDYMKPTPIETEFVEIPISIVESYKQIA